MSEQVGRRERKRLETRARIADAARTLFSERGFDSVRVAEVAELADVSEQTVYNHFPTKQDLVLWRRGTYESRLVESIRDRPAGQTALEAFGRYLTSPPSADPADTQHPVSITQTDIGRVIEENDALRAREHAIVAEHTAALARLLADETGAEPGDLRPQVAAAAMLGASQALVQFGREQVIGGLRPPKLTRAITDRANEVVELLDRGLGGYAAKPGQHH